MTTFELWSSIFQGPGMNLKSDYQGQQLHHLPGAKTWFGKSPAMVCLCCLPNVYLPFTNAVFSCSPFLPLVESSANIIGNVFHHSVHESGLLLSGCQITRLCCSILTENLCSALTKSSLLLSFPLCCQY